MKKSFLVTLAAVMLFSIMPGRTAHATSDFAHKHEYTKSKVIVAPTEAECGITRYYCKDVKTCGSYCDKKTAPLPDVYISKFRHSESGLCARVTVAQKYTVSNGELNITMEDWFATLMEELYNCYWEGENIRQRAIEFKAKDVGVGYFNDKVDSYSLTIPVDALTDCKKNGGLVVYLTTGAAMVRLAEDATSALIENAKDSIGVKASLNGDEIDVELLVDGKAVNTPTGVEVLYWLEDAKDVETASEEVLKTAKYMNFDTSGEFDVVYIESLNGVVNCNK